MIGAGETLTELYERLRAELGDSLNMAHSTDEMRPYQIHLNNAQRDLYDAWPWEGFDVEVDIPISKGQVDYDLPAQVDINKLYSAHVRYQGRWVALSHGISVSDNNIHDLDEIPKEGYDYAGRANPPERMDIVNVEGEQMIRIWPRPQVDTTVRLKARRALPKMQNNNDRCILDAQMIVLRAAANVMSRRGTEAAAASARVLKRDAAERFRIVKADNAGTTSDGFSTGLSELNELDAAKVAATPGRYRRYPGRRY